MALGGAWAFTLEGRNTVRATGRTFGADNDTATLGLNGDGTADGQLPAGWVAISTGSTGADFGLNGLSNAAIAAILQTRVRVHVNFLTDPTAGVAAAVGFVVTKNAAAPWQVTLNVQGAPAAPVQPEVYVEYLWSGSR